MRLIAVLGVALALHVAAVPASAWENWPGEWNPSRPSTTSSLRSEAGPEAIEPTSWIEANAFRLAVPHRTQKDGSRWQTSNCGPAILGMILDAYEIGGQSTDDLRFRAHTYQGTVGARTGTALQHIAQVANEFGVATTGLYSASGDFNRWSMDDIRGQLRQGRPVMPLVRLYQMPGYENIGLRWGHYVLLTGIAGDGFYYSDPLQTDPVAGTRGWISADQLARAMYNSHIPGQAVAFGGPTLEPLAILAQ